MQRTWILGAPRELDSLWDFGRAQNQGVHADERSRPGGVRVERLHARLQVVRSSMHKTFGGSAWRCESRALQLRGDAGPSGLRGFHLLNRIHVIFPCWFLRESISLPESVLCFFSPGATANGRLTSSCLGIEGSLGKDSPHFHLRPERRVVRSRVAWLIAATPPASTSGQHSNEKAHGSNKTILFEVLCGFDAQRNPSQILSVCAPAFQPHHPPWRWRWPSRPSRPSRRWPRRPRRMRRTRCRHCPGW